VVLDILFRYDRKLLKVVERSDVEWRYTELFHPAPIERNVLVRMRKLYAQALDLYSFQPGRRQVLVPRECFRIIKIGRVIPYSPQRVNDFANQPAA
jgi:hypothetical protein